MGMTEAHNGVSVVIIPRTEIPPLGIQVGTQMHHCKWKCRSGKHMAEELSAEEWIYMIDWVFRLSI